MLAPLLNAFCPTGKGGGQDNSCSSGNPSHMSDADLANSIRLYKEVLAPTKKNTARLQKLEAEQASRVPAVTSESLRAAAAELVKGAATSPEARGVRFGNKVLLSALREKSGLNKQDFDAAVLKMHKAGEVTLSRADLVAEMHPEDISESEVKEPGATKYNSVSYHFMRTDRLPPPMVNAFCPTGEGGGVDPSCSPGGTRTEGAGERPQKHEGLVESLKREVNAVADQTEFADEPVPRANSIGRYGPTTSEDYDAIEEAMTADERAALEESLMQAQDSAVESYMEQWEPGKVSFGDIMDHGDISFSEVEGTFHTLTQMITDPDVQEMVKDTIDNWDRESDHAAGAVSLRDHIKRAVPDVPQEYLDAVDEKINGFEAQMLDARTSLEDSMRENAERYVRENYEGYSDRRDALREFYQDNLERFEDDPEPHTWYKHSEGRNGGYELQFEAKNGQTYTIVADKIRPPGMEGLDVRFMDENESFSVTGKGGASDVFMNVMGSLQKLMDVESPEVLTFSAAEASRRKLYDRIVKTMAKLNPNMSAVYMDTDGARYYAVTPRENKEKVLAYVEQKHEIKPTVLVNEWIMNQWVECLTINAYCPTGPGGGIDNSCGPRGRAGATLEGQAVADDEEAFAQAVLEQYREMTKQIPSTGRSAEGNVVTTKSEIAPIMSERSKEEEDRLQEWRYSLYHFGSNPDWELDKSSTDARMVYVHKATKSTVELTSAFTGSKRVIGTKLTMNRVNNAFCPTGPGGGQDNSCSPRGQAGASKEANDYMDAGSDEAYAAKVAAEMKAMTDALPKGGGKLRARDNSLEWDSGPVGLDTPEGQDADDRFWDSRNRFEDMGFEQQGTSATVGPNKTAFKLVHPSGSTLEAITQRGDMGTKDEWLQRTIKLTMNKILPPLVNANPAGCNQHTGPGCAGTSFKDEYQDRIRKLSPEVKAEGRKLIEALDAAKKEHSAAAAADIKARDARARSARRDTRDGKASAKSVKAVLKAEAAEKAAFEKLSTLEKSIQPFRDKHGVSVHDLRRQPIPQDSRLDSEYINEHGEEDYAKGLEEHYQKIYGLMDKRYDGGLAKVQVSKKDEGQDLAWDTGNIPGTVLLSAGFKPSADQSEWTHPRGHKYSVSDKYHLLVHNVFCATGPGGGVDPTCSPGGSKAELSGSMEHKEGYETTEAGDIYTTASIEGFEEQDALLLEEMERRNWSPVVEKALRTYTNKKVGGQLNYDARTCQPLPDCSTDPDLFEDIQKGASERLEEPQTVYRGIYGKYAEMVANMEEGEVLDVAGFVSTSLNKQVASDFSKTAKPGDKLVVMKIVAKTGAYVAGVSHFPNELEILQRHGVQYRVRGRTEEGDITVMHMEEVE